MARITAINAWMKEYAAANGHLYLDYFAAMTDPEGLLRAELSEDDLHPNAAGYAIMGPLAEAAIQTALKNRKEHARRARARRANRLHRERRLKINRRRAAR
jgi:lysophospholipase L1-like esterase